MVVIRPPVWINIWLTLIGTVVFAQIFDAGEVQVSVCVGTNLCNLFSLNCSVGERIQINSLQYGIYGSRNSQCRNTNCGDETKSCCTYADGDCLQNFTEYHKNLILSQCSGNSYCGPLVAVSNVFHALPNCQGPSSQYIVIVYICIHGTDTTVQLTSTTNGLSSSGNTSSSSGTDTTVQLTSTTTGLSSSGKKSSSSGVNEDGNNLPTIIGVVIAAISVIAVVVVALILFRRKIQDKALKTSSTEQISPTRCTVANNVLESINPNPENYASLDKCELDNAEYDQLTHDYINTIDTRVEGGHIVPNYANIPAASAPDIHNVAESTNRTKAAML